MWLCAHIGVVYHCYSRCWAQYPPFERGSESRVCAGMHATTVQSPCTTSKELNCASSARQTAAESVKVVRQDCARSKFTQAASCRAENGAQTAKLRELPSDWHEPRVASDEALRSARNTEWNIHEDGCLARSEHPVPAAGAHFAGP